MEAEGPETAVDTLMELLHVGPPSATVTDVAVRSVVPHANGGSFDILH